MNLILLSIVLCCSGANIKTLSLSKSLALPTQKNMLWLIPIMEHAFSDKPLSAIAYLLGFGATTRDGVQGVLVACTVLILLDVLLNSPITML